MGRPTVGSYGEIPRGVQERASAVLSVQTLWRSLRTRHTLEPLAWHWSHWPGRLVNQGGRGFFRRRRGLYSRPSAEASRGRSTLSLSLSRSLSPALSLILSLSHAPAEGVNPCGGGTVQGTSRTRNAHPRSIAIGAWAYAYCRVLGGCGFL